MKWILASVFLLFAASVAAVDSCRRAMPPSLVTAIEKAYPAFRMPREMDNQARDVEYDRQSGGSGCLGVASADFDGDGVNDWLLGLSATQGDAALVVLALAHGKHWQLHVLSKWTHGRDRLYVEAGGPGIYRRSEALDGPVSGDEVMMLDCAHVAAVFGAVESTGTAWCPVRRSWRHVQFSD